MSKEIIQLKKQRSRDLRNNQTPAEKLLWRHLRRRCFFNLKFLRQYPIVININNKKIFFIADFYCHQNKIIIEVDGKIHDSQKDYDDTRENILNNTGYKIIRFKNEEIFQDIKKVLIKLEEFIKK
jgi:very-short-patch-repair endonuclease